jgi:hypothetical protein
VTGVRNAFGLAKVTGVMPVEGHTMHGQDHPNPTFTFRRWSTRPRDLMGIKVRPAELASWPTAINAPLASRSLAMRVAGSLRHNLLVNRRKVPSELRPDPCD